MKKPQKTINKSHKIILLKRLTFAIITCFLFFDIIFLPFVTEPFTFKNGISETYIFGSAIALLTWIYFTWLNFAKLSEIIIFRFENLILFAKMYSSDVKHRYYFNLNLIIKFITIILAAIILLGFYSILDQHSLALQNMLKFFGN